MYLACIPHVFRMYSACIPHVSWLPLRIHVSRMYLACIPHVSFISDTSLSGCIWDTCISSCISDVSQMYLDHPCRYMYLACIPHVSCISDTYRSGYIQEVSISDNVSYMYPAYVSILDVSWCMHVSWRRVQDTRILMYPDMYPVWHQGSVQDTCIVMYLMCIPKCILDSFGIRVKYMQNVKIHVFSRVVDGLLGSDGGAL
jgi:hypothetical protein